jgi:hypothetical protein
MLRPLTGTEGVLVVTIIAKLYSRQSQIRIDDFVLT